jgi:hypothetical protein
MKQYVLVAGVDFEFAGVDFRVLCDNRRRRLVNANRSHSPLRLTTIDIRAGKKLVTDVTYTSGRARETTKEVETFRPVTRASYQNVTYPDGSTHVRFKAGQYGTASILDAYSTVRAIGVSDPGSLAELSFFSHGWMGGPLLLNSIDNRSALVPVPNAGGPPQWIPYTAFGRERDPDDMDPRTQYDFVAPTMDVAARNQLQAAFDRGGFIWLWGCAFPRVLHRVLHAIEQGRGYRQSGLGDEATVSLEGLDRQASGYLMSFLRSLVRPLPAAGARISLKFKYLRQAVCLMNQSAYAVAFAEAAGVPVRAPALGTYAEYEQGQLPLMRVHPGFTARFAFYRNYLGMNFHPDGRHYAIYPPTFSCPWP